MFYGTCANSILVWYISIDLWLHTNRPCPQLLGHCHQLPRLQADEPGVVCLLSFFLGLTCAPAPLVRLRRLSISLVCLGTNSGADTRSSARTPTCLLSWNCLESASTCGILVLGTCVIVNLLSYGFSNHRYRRTDGDLEF